MFPKEKSFAKKNKKPSLQSPSGIEYFYKNNVNF